MSETKPFKLKLAGTGISIDQSVSKELASRIVMLVLSDGKSEEDQTKRGEAGGAGSETLTRKPTANTTTSLREFLNLHKAKKITEQIVAIGSYRQTKGGADHFTRAELDSGFEEAKAQAPGNPSRDIARVITLGWIAPKAGKKNEYYVTGTGEAAIESNFLEHTKGGRGDRRRGKRVKKTAKKPAKSATK